MLKVPRPGPLLRALLLGWFLVPGSLPGQDHHGHDHGPGGGHPAGGAPSGSHAHPELPAEELALLQEIGRVEQQLEASPQDSPGLKLKLIELLRQHQSRFPLSPEAMTTLQVLVGHLVENQDKVGAEKALTDLIARSKNQAIRDMAELSLARLYLHFRDYDKSVASLRRQRDRMAADPNALNVVFQLAQVMANNGDYDGAVAELETQLGKTKEPADALALRMRIIDIRTQGGRYDAALAAAAEVEKETLDVAQANMVTFFKAQARFGMGRTGSGDQARAALDEAAHLFDSLLRTAENPGPKPPALAMAMSAAADLHLYRNDLDRARRIYEKMAEVFKGERQSFFARRVLTDLEWIGKPAAAFSAPGLGPKTTVTLSDHRGKVVLLHFWAMWSDSGGEDIPTLLQLERDLAGKPFQIISVSLDPEAKREELQGYAARNGMTWPHAHDGKVFDSDVVKSYRVSGVPTTFLIDHEGTIVRVGLRGPHLKDVAVATLQRIGTGK